MYDREAFESVASEIAAVGESPRSSCRCPSCTRHGWPPGRTTWPQSLNAFNGICPSHDDGHEPSTDGSSRALGAGHPAGHRHGDLHPRHHPARAPGGAPELTPVPGLGDGHPPARPATTIPLPAKAKGASACPTLPAACPHA